MIRKYISIFVILILSISLFSCVVQEEAKKVSITLNPQTDTGDGNGDTGTGNGGENGEPEEDTVKYDPGVTDETIKIGTSIVKSGRVQVLGMAMDNGAKIYFDKINSEGGINGRKIELVTYDDAYDTTRAIENTKKLVNEDNVFLLFNYLGTQIGLSIEPMLKSLEIPMLNVMSGSTLLRQKVNEYLFFTSATYENQIKGITSYFVEELGLKKIAILYPNDPTGAEFLRGATEELNEYGIEPFAVTSIETELKELPLEDVMKGLYKNGTPDAIMIGSSLESEKIIAEAYERDKDIYFFIPYGNAPRELLLRALGEESSALNRVFQTQTYPSLTDNIEITRSLKSNKEDYEYSGELPQMYNVYGLEYELIGYINAVVMVETLKKMGDNLTRENFIKTLQNTEENIMGLNFKYSEEDRNGLKDIFIKRIDTSVDPFHYVSIDYDFGLKSEQKGSFESAVEQGVTKSTITLGTSLPLTGRVSVLGHALNNGAKMCFDWINEKGGVKGRKIEIKTYDDGYDTARAIENTQKLVNEDHVFTLFNYFGTQIGLSIEPMLENMKMPILNIMTGSTALRSLQNRYLFFTASTYESQIKSITSYFIEDLGLKKISVLYPNNPTGAEFLRGISEELKDHGLEVFSAVSQEPIRKVEDIPVDKISEQLLAKGLPDAVMFGTSFGVEQIITIISEKSKDMYYYVPYGNITRFQLIMNLKDDADALNRIFQTQAYPSYDEELALIDLFESIRSRYDYPDDLPKDYHKYGVEYELIGFINAMVFIEAVKDIEGSITRENFIKTLETMDKNIEGLQFKYTPTNRNGLQENFMKRIDTSIKPEQYVNIDK